MKDIHKLYYNDLGIIFKWKNINSPEARKIQLVFRDTGLSLTKKQLLKLLECTTHVIDNVSLCETCKNDESIKPLLLETPTSMVSFAMSYMEIIKMEDLIKGALFQLEMDEILKKNKLS